MKRGFILTAIISIFSLSALAQEQAGTSPQDWGIEYQRGALKVGVWSSTFAGDIKFVKEEGGERIGEELDLVDDLELENPQGAFNFEIELKASRRNRFNFSFFGVEYTGNVQEVEGIDVYEFSGGVFDIDIDTSVSLSKMHLGYEFLPFVTPRGDLGLMLGIDYYTLGISLESNEPEAKEDEYLPIPIPVVGVRGQYTFGYGLGVYGGVHGMGIGFEDGEASFSETELGLSFKYKRFYSSVGYRSVNWSIEVGDDVGDEDYGRLKLTQDGGIINAGINF